MSAAELLLMLSGLGIRVEAQGDRLRFHPRSAVTADLAERMKTQKGALLQLLRTPDPPAAPAPAVDWIEVIDAEGRLSLAHPDHVDGFVPWSECVPADFTCARCRYIGAWWDSSGTAHCQRCEPPTETLRLSEIVRGIRRRERTVAPSPPNPSIAENSAMSANCRCSATTTVEVPIHGGQSRRRDCSRCARFIDFSIWYGNVLDNRAKTP